MFNKLIVIIIVLLSILYQVFSRKVIVTGAAGRTGSLVYKKLLESNIYEPVGIVRTEKSSKQLLKQNDGKGNVKVADITDVNALEKAFTGADSLILCTSAVPKIKFLSIVKVLIFKLFRKKATPSFRFIPNGDPYNVDWLGAKNQIDAAKRAGIKHFVFLSSMGGTQPENFLNTIGKIKDDDKSGNILLWKRKAEEYLIQSGLEYTIIHPGGLTDKKGGESEVIFGINDELLKGTIRQIPRDDVATCCIKSLESNDAKNRSFDITAKSPLKDDKTNTIIPTSNWNLFFSSNKGNCIYENK